MKIFIHFILKIISSPKICKGIYFFFSYDVKWVMTVIQLYDWPRLGPYEWNYWFFNNPEKAVLFFGIKSIVVVAKPGCNIYLFQISSKSANVAWNCNKHTNGLTYKLSYFYLIWITFIAMILQKLFKNKVITRKTC